jgi:hypothetical protein
MALVLVIFFLVLLGIAGGVSASIAIYKRQSSTHAMTLERIKHLNTELLNDVRFDGFSQLRRTNAGRELLLLLEKNGEVTFLQDAWSDFGYRKKKRTAVRKNEIQFRYKNKVSSETSGRRSRITHYTQKPA